MYNRKSTNSNEPAGSLEARLRALPPPSVPARLERRLLAAIPSRRSVAPRRRLAWSGACGALAAACVLVVLIWAVRDRKRLAADRAESRQLVAVSSAPAAAIARENTEPIFDISKPPKFTWPLAGVSSLPASSRAGDIPLD